MFLGERYHLQVNQVNCLVVMNGLFRLHPLNSAIYILTSVYRKQELEPEEKREISIIKKLGNCEAPPVYLIGGASLNFSFFT